MIGEIKSTYLKATGQQAKYICHTCNRALKSGNLPVQAACNGLELTPVPQELRDLNQLEVRLISQRIPFLKMVALPRGKQQAIHGAAINVPTNFIMFAPFCHDFQWMLT